jgi:hypothetical protein
MLRKFEKNPLDLCLSRTLWALKNEVWGEDGHRQRRKVEQQRRIEMRTKKPTHPDLQPTPRFHASERSSDATGGFVPLGSVVPQLPAARPVPPERPRPMLSPPSTTKDAKPSEEWRSLEQEWLKNGLVNPKKD